MSYRKISVGVLMGGPSEEHEVSLDTGKNILGSLDRKKFSGTPLVLSKHLRLYAGEKMLAFPKDLKKFDIIFNALHGSFGEDGKLQAILESHDVSYTGSGPAASCLGMDKWLALTLFKNSGLRIAPSQLLHHSKARFHLKLPLVVKPRASGSSVGVSIVKSKKTLTRSLEKAFRYGDVILEKYLTGREFTCPVLERNGKLAALPVIEIKPAKKYEFFDYEAKYMPGATREMVPAPIPKKLERTIQNAALRAHTLLGCRAYSRSDFIWSRNTLYILEINTLPGLTANSLVPKSARAAGISFPRLLEIIIFSSLRYFKKR